MYVASALDRSPDTTRFDVHSMAKTCSEVLAIWLAALLVVAILAACDVNPAAVPNNVTGTSF